MAEPFRADASPEAARSPELSRENVAGHTRKVVLLREACERLRTRRGDGPLRIRDVGCGSGYAVNRFLNAADDGVLGIDSTSPTSPTPRAATRGPV